MKFMIHACPQRMWYVTGYLVPSMTAQGIPKDDIIIWNDEKGDGCLYSCMNAFASCEGDGATWHMQDDVIIAHDFAERCEEWDDLDQVVCGFCHTLFEPFNRPMVGEVPAVFSFNSFPCIHIPDRLARECAEWFFTDAQYRPQYKNWVNSRKHDDSFWHDFFVERHSHDKVINLAPAMVEHIDWLIGDSTVNSWRGYVCRASYWEDEYLVEDLKRSLLKNTR